MPSGITTEVKTYQIYINGEWTDGKSKKAFASRQRLSMTLCSTPWLATARKPVERQTPSTSRPSARRLSAPACSKAAKSKTGKDVGMMGSQLLENCEVEVIGAQLRFEFARAPFSRLREKVAGGAGRMRG